MLNAMRGNRKFLTIVLWIVILAFLSTIFVVWGLGPNETEGNFAVKIDGKSLPYAEYRNFYDSSIATLKESYGPLFEQFAEENNIDEVIQNDFINRYLLIEEAKRIGVIASDDEVISFVASIPNFQTGGVFDPVMYQEILASNRMSPTMFEESVRDDLYLSKIRDLISTAGLVVTDQEIDLEHKARTTTRNISYAMIPTSKFFPDNISDENLKIFLDSNQDNYRTEKEIKVKYAIFKKDDFNVGDIKIEDKDVEERYAKNIEKYTTGDKVTTLDKVKKEITSELRKEQLDSVYRAYILEQFKEILSAGNITAFSKTEKGKGLVTYKTGFFNQNTIPLKLANLMNINRLFKLSKSDTSQLIQDGDFIYLFEIEDAKESVIPAFDTIKKTVLTDYKKSVAGAIALEGVSKSMVDKDINAIAKQYNVRVNKYNGFNAETNLNAVDNVTLMRSILTLDGGVMIDKPYLVNDYVVVTRVDKKNLSNAKMTEDEKEEIVGYIRSVKAPEALITYVESLREGKDIIFSDIVMGINNTHNH